MAVLTETTVVQTVQALMRHNLLARVLTHPGAQALPASPGEAISRFRDDAHEPEDWCILRTLEALLHPDKSSREEREAVLVLVDGRVAGVLVREVLR